MQPATTAPSCRLSELIGGLHPSELATAPLPIEGVVRALAHHADEIIPASVFVAIKGQKVDGHAYLAQAAAQGALAAVIDRRFGGHVPRHLPVIRVRDTKRALANLAHGYYRYPAQRLEIIAVTGTNGKTTTTALLGNIAAATGKKVGVIGTLGASWQNQRHATGLTTPDALGLAKLLYTMLQDGIETVCMEASSIALQQQRLQALQIDAAVYTNLTPDHLDQHGSMQTYFAAKQKLHRLRKPGAPTIVNCDDAWMQTLLHEQAGDKVGYSCVDHPMAAYCAQKVRCGRDGSRLRLVGRQTLLHLHTSLLGHINISNVVAAAATALSVGWPAPACTNGIAQTQGVAGRMQTVLPMLPHLPWVVVDYAHTPVALALALQTLRALLSPNQRLWCVFGCGGERDPGKRAPMGMAAAQNADVVVVTADNSRGESLESIVTSIEAGIVAAGMPPLGANTMHGYKVILSRWQAIVETLQQASPGDAVLLAGKGHETVPFADADVAKAWLQSC